MKIVVTLLKGKELEVDPDFLFAIDHFNKDDLAQEKTEELLPDNFLICECAVVDVGMIRAICKSKENLTEEFLTTNLGMGKACRKCIRSMPSWRELIFKKNM